MFRKVNHSLSGVTPSNAWQGLSGNENHYQQAAKHTVFENGNHYHGLCDS